MPKRIASARFAPQPVTAGLGLLADLAGTWEGHGFNLIARPDFHDQTDLYLQLNHTREHLKFDPIGSPIPNRGFGQDDIELFGLTYGIENIRFLAGQQVPVGTPPVTQPEENAQTALVYATFWIEKATRKADGSSIMQLQYAQMVILNFPVFHLLRQNPPVFVNLGWPHISVATLRKTFG